MAIGKNPSNNELSNQDVTQRLGKQRITPLLLHYALPAIVGTLVVSLYNIVDRIFIGQGVGPEAISGLALTFPIMTLSAACGMLVGTGAGARISIYLGKGERDSACHVLGNSLVLILIIASIYSISNYYYMDEILEAFGGSATTIPYAKEYLQVIIPFSILTNVSFGFNNMMRASGYPRKAMLTMLISAIANVILDPIFIFVFDMGIRGAAIATVISMAITTIWVISHYMNPKHEVHFTASSFKLNRKIILGIISIGMSPFLINVTASGVNVFLNRSLQQFGGDLAIGAYGIINSFAMLTVMLVIGLSQGMQPIVGYNYGAMRYDRVVEVVKKTTLVATGFTSIGFLLAMFAPHWITAAFTTDPSLSEISTRGLRLILAAFPLIGFQVVITNVFQSLGMAPIAVLLSLSRQVLLLLPLIWILPHFWQLDGVWIAAPIADTGSAILAASMLLWQYNRIKKRHPERFLKPQEA